MSRSTHRFCPGPLELFEDRIVPSGLDIVGHPGDLAFTPPGHEQETTNDTSGHFWVNDGTSKVFNVSPDGNSISTSITNLTGQTRFVTIAFYTAPGGDWNAASQKMAYSMTLKLDPGQKLDVDINVQNLINSNQLKLTGQDSFQVDLYEAPDINGYAPEKLYPGTPGEFTITGELFDSDHTNNGKKK